MTRTKPPGSPGGPPTDLPTENTRRKTRAASIIPPRARPTRQPKRVRTSAQTPRTKWVADIVRDGDEWITRRCRPGVSIPIDRSGGKVMAARTEYFLLHFDERLRSFELQFTELVRYVADHADNISSDDIEEVCQRLEDEFLYVGENFRRGFAQRLILLLPDLPALERKVAHLAKPIDGIRHLADQDYYEYTPAHLREIKRTFSQRIDQLREGYKVGLELSRIKGGAD